MQIVRAWRHFGFDNDQRRAMDVVADFLLFFLDAPKRGQSESAITLLSAPLRAPAGESATTKNQFSSAGIRPQIEVGFRPQFEAGFRPPIIIY